MYGYLLYLLPLALRLPLTTHRNRSSWDGGEEMGVRGPPGQMFQHEAFVAALSIAFCRWTITSSTFRPNAAGRGRRRRGGGGEEEPPALRAFFVAVLAALAYRRRPYDVTCAVQLCSYAVPLLLPLCRRLMRGEGDEGGGSSGGSGTGPTAEYPARGMGPGRVWARRALGILLLPLSAALSLLLCRWTASGALLSFLRFVSPPVVGRTLRHLFPIDELVRAHSVVLAFAESRELVRAQIAHLLFVTFNVQLGMGYLGIDFLRAEQTRRNMVVKMELTEGDEEESGKGDKEKSSSSSSSSSATVSDPAVGPTTALREKQMESSRVFRRTAAPYIFFTVFPYMFQIITMGNVNMFSYACFRDDVHRAVREGPLLEGNGQRLVKMSEKEATSPDAYAASMDTVIATSYDLFNRKLFSVPKLALLPGVILRQPTLLVKIFPFIFVSDMVQARFVSTLTSTVERLGRETRALTEIRRKVEAFDMKNAELLRRSGKDAATFTATRWEELTEEIQNKNIASELLKRTRGFYNWIQRNFVFSQLIDCTLAQLIAVGQIAAAEIFVFSRAIEDTVDLVLMRSRAESELATMMTEMDKLMELSDLWEKSTREGGRRLLPCTVAEGEGAEGGGSVILQNLRYSRGTAAVRVDHLELVPGIYAVTGANGSGKSTLFRVVMSCATNIEAVDLPDSILLGTALSGNDDDADTKDDRADFDFNNHEASAPFIILPSSNVAEISQTFYWPLYTRPVDWIYQRRLPDTPGNKDDDHTLAMVNRVATELMALAFVPSVPDAEPLCPSEGNGNDDAVTVIAGGAPASAPAPTVPPVSIAISNLEAELMEKKEDWFGDLSGGQKSKVELVRKVFLHESCPKVLLIDETMAPLDPTSKSLVMSRIRNFCDQSVILVIYHTDVGKTTPGGEGGREGAEEEECVPSNDFFDSNLHVENGGLIQKNVC